jgi:hypothetical protein
MQRAGVMLAALLCLLVATLPAQGWSREWLCFFQNEDYAMTDRCKLIMSEAADNWHLLREGRAFSNPPMGTTLRPPLAATIHVVGHAADGGSPTENERLGLRRALVVIAELRRLGIPDQYLIPVSLGDRQPWGEAAQNRRVRLEWREPPIQP